MKDKALYPPTTDFIADKYVSAVEAFAENTDREGIFIGLSLLDGTFDIAHPQKLRDELRVGEILTLVPEKSKSKTPPLAAFRGDTPLGYIPSAAATVPLYLMSLDETVKCYVECFSFASGVLSIGVSLFLDRNPY